MLIVASYTFYGWWDWRFLTLIVFSSAVDFVAAQQMVGSDSVRRRMALGVSLIVNLGVLGFFKYFGFFAESLTAVLEPMGFRLTFVDLNIVLPVGISFYTLQTLSYTIDVYQGRCEPTRRVSTFFAYVCFFPQLVAGPIERATSLLPQFERPAVFDDARSREGLRWVLWGLFKKVVIADGLALQVDPIFGQLDSVSGATVWLAAVLFAGQIYADFSGYSDMAIGLAMLLGFQLMKNFDRPYFAVSPADFWRRWHISLSTWFRDYVYIPLGGSRRGRWRTAWNLWVVFTASGLWHGASWNFVLWGWLHFLVVAASHWIPLRMPRTSPIAAKSMAMFATAATMVWCWIPFREPDAAVALSAMGRALTFWDGGGVEASRIGLAYVVLLMFADGVSGSHGHPLRLARYPWPIRWAVYSLLVGGVLAVRRGDQPFIYFQF